MKFSLKRIITALTPKEKMSAVEEYLSKSVDLCDLERRQDILKRRGIY